MNSKRNALGIAAILAAALLTFAIYIGLHSAFGRCVDKAAESYRTEHSTQNNNPIAVPAFYGYGSCANLVTRHDGNVITALATALLTVVTALLTWITWVQMSSTRAQIRAYVFLEGANLKDGTTVTPQNLAMADVPGYEIAFKNTGQSPAKDVVTWVQIDVIEPRHENTLTVPKLEKKSAISIGAGGSIPKALWFSRPLNQQEILDVGSGTKRIYVYGRAEYTDIVGFRRFTNVRVFYQGAFPHPNMQFIVSDEGNEFS